MKDLRSPPCTSHRAATQARPALLAALSFSVFIGCGGAPSASEGVSDDAITFAPLCPIGESCLTVTNTQPNGPGSLAAALYGAGLDPDDNRIMFNIPGNGPHVIATTYSLYSEQTIIIDGYSQPGAARATATTPATIKVVLDGGDAIERGLILKGDSSRVSGLAIHGYTASGIKVEGADDVRIDGCYIGTDELGAAAIGNFEGISVVFSNRTLIGGATVGARNIISGNTQGIGDLLGAETRIEGNYIGTDASGTLDLGNGIGVLLAATDARIGGATEAVGNLISGNADGIVIEGSNNRVEGNLIGTDKSGTGALGNLDGVTISTGAQGNLIGGSGAAANLISGNTLGTGVVVFGDRNFVVGNKIGTDVSGRLALGNLTGVNVLGGENLIGSTLAGLGNLISGNEQDGVIIQDSFAGPSIGGNVVVGNGIGVDVDGLLPLGNGQHGVFIVDANLQVIGGTVAGAGNTIGGNGEDGVFIEANAALSGIANIVAGNHIGTDPDGLIDLGNGGSGVRISGGVDNWIGGASPGQRNRIAFNAEDGVAVELGAGHALLGNAIWGNGALAIDLGPSGVTSNDGLGDVDSGANQLQNFPKITSVVTAATSLTVSWELKTAPSISVRVELFSSPACRASGVGDAARFLGAVTVTTDATGFVSRQSEIAAPPGAGEYVTATATHIAGPLARNTSELSKCVVIP